MGLAVAPEPQQGGSDARVTEDWRGLVVGADSLRWTGGPVDRPGNTSPQTVVWPEDRAGVALGTPQSHVLRRELRQGGAQEGGQGPRCASAGPRPPTDVTPQHRERAGLQRERRAEGGRGGHPRRHHSAPRAGMTTDRPEAKFNKAPLETGGSRAGRGGGAAVIKLGNKIKSWRWGPWGGERRQRCTRAHAHTHTEHTHKGVRAR